MDSKTIKIVVLSVLGTLIAVPVLLILVGVFMPKPMENQDNLLPKYNPHGKD
jgi:hypothetical protein